MAANKQSWKETVWTTAKKEVPFLEDIEHYVIIISGILESETFTDDNIASVLNQVIASKYAVNFGETWWEKSPLRLAWDCVRVGVKGN